MSQSRAERPRRVIVCRSAGILLFLLPLFHGCSSNTASSTSNPASPAKTAPDSNSATSHTALASVTGGSQKPKQPAPPVIAGDRMSGVPIAPIVMSKQTESSPFRFSEIAQQSGIDFVHFSGMTEAKHFPTANGSGVAILDYDGDGLLDIYFATATLLPLGTAVKGPNRLYKNLGKNQFKEVTEAAGVGFRGFCHGIIAGDIDNDGDQDLFLCNYGGNVLYLNNGNGTFKDISKEAGIDSPNWSSSGAMLDYDNDGYLDIYVTNYGTWRYPEDHKPSGDEKNKDLALLLSPLDPHRSPPLLSQ